jgi:hypothetical protein
MVRQLYTYQVLVLVGHGTDSFCLLLPLLSSILFKH